MVVRAALGFWYNGDAMDYVIKPPLSQRLNLKLIVFLAVVILPFIWFFYFFVSQFVTGGIVDRGGYKEVDLKALGYFRMDQVNGSINDVPPRYRELDGKRVMLVGMM